jgi:hypothetical protein
MILMIWVIGDLVELEMSKGVTWLCVLFVNHPGGKKKWFSSWFSRLGFDSQKTCLQPLALSSIFFCVVSSFTESVVTPATLA